MEIFEVILIGIALSMDAFAVTIANCANFKDNLSKIKEWAMPVSFALFQFIMPIIGFYIGSALSSILSKIAGYLTAGIFFVLFIKIVFDIVKDGTQNNKESDNTSSASSFSYMTLFVQSIATSLDALFVGISFAVHLPFSVFVASAIIGLVTFILVTIALFVGKGLGKILGKFAIYLSATLLFILAVKNLISAII